MLLLENVTIRMYGQLRCLQGNTGVRTVNPVVSNCTIPKVDKATANKMVDLSPAKSAPIEKTVETLDEIQCRQQFVWHTLKIPTY